MLKKFIFSGCVFFFAFQAFAQKPEQIITLSEVTRIENTLASDAMRGRKVFTPDIDKAADFIAGEFKSAGLKPLPGLKGFKQDFRLLSMKTKQFTVTVNGQSAAADNWIAITTDTLFAATESSGLTRTSIPAGKSLTTEAQKLIRSGKPWAILVDTSYAKQFPRLAGFRRQLYSGQGPVLFYLGTQWPAPYSVSLKQEGEIRSLSNVVGILPGTTRKNEYVIFSGHYDHLGVSSRGGTDSIYNGANDDAAGCTAVMMLARYYAKLHNNTRTLIFTTFTGEESGGMGSTYFSLQFDPAQVMAMFNIEMIGTQSKWGTNSAYITGYEKTNMGEILAKNLTGTGFTFYPDPYPQQQLFYRSDNATLARQGVPAHTISTSKMDSEPNYHKVSDEVSTLDLENMVQIIRAVALSAKTIIAGTDTPTRVNPDNLR